MADQTFELDGRVVGFTEGQSILEASLNAGIYIPHLCRHPDLPVSGACGMCVVEKDGVTVRACSTPAEAGSHVVSVSPALVEIRTVAMQLMLASHIDDCNSCPKYLKCEFQSLIQQQGATTGSFKRSFKGIAQNTENPLFIRDMERCIACGRCVRACNDIRHIGALTYASDEKGRKYVVTKAENLRESDCRFCGACVEVCPTGALRDKDGVFAERFAKGSMLIPCAYECPAHLDIPEYLRFIRLGDSEQAMAKIMERVPFPRSLGSICMRFCENKCRRQYLDESVSVCALKRYAAVDSDGAWMKQIRMGEDTHKKIAVVGAGPAGLTAAWFLRLKGHSVEVFEKQSEPGGMMRYGMPEYRLSLEELRQDIETICSVGVTVHCDCDITERAQLDGFDAVLWCGGAPAGVRLPVKGVECDGILTGLDFLKDLRLGRKPEIGKNVLVLGGGDVAYDCARSAVRLGAEAAVCCLEPEDKMTSSEHERVEGTQEGVKAYTGRTFERIVSENGRVAGMECCFVSRFEFDADGKLVLEKDAGSLHTIPCDTIIFAVGQKVVIPEGMGIAVDGKGRAVIDGNCRSDGNFFAAGDAVTSTSSVVQAVAWGQKAAAAIDLYLGGDGNVIPKIAVEQKKNKDIHENCFFNALRMSGEMLCADERKAGFGAYVSVLDPEEAVRQASRCLQCDLRKEITRPRFYNEYSGQKRGESA